jgi:hypothetical protein
MKLLDFTYQLPILSRYTDVFFLAETKKLKECDYEVRDILKEKTVEFK